MGTVAKLFLVGLISCSYRLNANSVATMADSAVNPILFLVICVMYWIRERQFRFCTKFCKRLAGLLKFHDVDIVLCDSRQFIDEGS